jgi:hypothetical protein
MPIRTVLIVRSARDGTVNGPEQRAFAVINGLPDFLLCAPDERAAEAS